MITHDDDRRGADAAGRDQRLEALLAESGIDAAPGDALVSALAELAAVGTGEPPVPSPELAALLDQAPDAHLAPARRRPRSRRARTAIATVTAAACLSGVGVAAAAAGSPAFRHSVGHTFSAIVRTLTASRHEAPVPPGTVTRTSGAPAPTSGEASRIGVVPVTPDVVAPHPTPSGTPQDRGSAGQATPPPQPPATPGRDAQPPTAVPPAHTPTAPPATGHPTDPPTAPASDPGTPPASPPAAPRSGPATPPAATHP